MDVEETIHEWCRKQEPGSACMREFGNAKAVMNVNRTLRSWEKGKGIPPPVWFEGTIPSKTPERWNPKAIVAIGRTWKEVFESLREQGKL